MFREIRRKEKHRPQYKPQQKFRRILPHHKPYDQLPQPISIPLALNIGDFFFTNSRQRGSKEEPKANLSSLRTLTLLGLFLLTLTPSSSEGSISVIVSFSGHLTCHAFLGETPEALLFPFFLLQGVTAAAWATASAHSSTISSRDRGLNIVDRAEWGFYFEWRSHISQDEGARIGIWCGGFRERKKKSEERN